MQSRRDHLQAYQFAVERLVRATITGRTNASEAPLRRSGLGLSMGIVLSGLLCGGALVYGLISPAPSQAWRAAGAIIVEKETGTRYLLIDGVLRPTANYSSALLAAGQNASVQFVARAQLAGVPVGTTIGIAGAPEEVPTAAALLPGSWALCSQQNGAVVLNLDPAGATTPGPADERVLVASTAPGDPAEYVIWNSVKHPLPQPTVLSALGLGDQQPTPVDPAWLAALPTGAALEPPAVAHAGEPGPPVAGAAAPIGTVYSTTAGDTVENYILLSDGLAPITRTEAALFALDGRGAARQISTAAVAAAPVSADRDMLAALPDLMSGSVFNTHTTGESLCVRQSAPGSSAGSTVVLADASNVQADQPVVLPAGAGMLVEPPGQSSYSPDPLLYLITDSGRRYQIDSTNALDALGYASAARVVMPESVLALVPSGPALDVAAAAQATP